MKKTLVCSICEEGTLFACVGANQIEYKGQSAALDLHYSECDCCGSEQSSSEQLRDNKRLVIAFKKKVDGLLVGSEVKEIRLSLGLTQAGAAKVFGGGPVAFAKYEADDVAQSEAMDKLIRVTHAIPAAYAYLTQSSYNESIAESISDWDWTRLFVSSDLAMRPPKQRPSLRIVSSQKLNEENGWMKQAIGQ
jgi:HTH-type transcriptional regulator/antitoxin MqsA